MNSANEKEVSTGIKGYFERMFGGGGLGGYNSIDLSTDSVRT